MKTLLHYEQLPFDTYLQERVGVEAFDFFVTSGPECDLEVKMDVSHIMHSEKVKREVEYQCFLEGEGLLEIFTSKVEGYKNKDGLKFGIRSKYNPEDLFYDEKLRNLLGLALVVKPKDEKEMALFEEVLKDYGYRVSGKKLIKDRLEYRLSKSYGYFVVTSRFFVNTEEMIKQNKHLNEIAHQFFGTKLKIKN